MTYNEKVEFALAISLLREAGYSCHKYTHLKSTYYVWKPGPFRSFEAHTALDAWKRAAFYLLDVAEEA